MTGQEQGEQHAGQKEDQRPSGQFPALIDNLMRARSLLITNQLPMNIGRV